MGDGVNDWAALAGASVGVAVAKSPADVPHLKGGVLLLRDNGVEAIPLLLKVAAQTQSIIHQVGSCTLQHTVEEMDGCLKNEARSGRRMCAYTILPLLIMV